MKDIKRVVVLLSGGQDSTTCLFWAMKEYPGAELHCVSFDYGQRHKRELECAANIVNHVAQACGELVSHTVLPLNALSMIGGNALVDRTEELTTEGGHDDDEAHGGLPSSYVPGRNILFITLAAAYAVKVGAERIVTGVCQTDYSGYPDCRHSFIQSLQSTLDAGMPSSKRVQIITPLMFMTKADTVKLMAGFGARAWLALGMTITCYYGKRNGCTLNNMCASCELRYRGFQEAGCSDPARQ